MGRGDDGHVRRAVEQKLGPKMRWLLMARGPMNLGGVFAFAPPSPHLRNTVGLPEGTRCTCGF